MAVAFGAFGKMPALGDFFRIGLPRTLVEPWDTWLQSTMLAVRDALGQSWQDNYLTAPIWRFTLSPGLAGPQAVLGVLMASIDRVGRQFPLTLCASVPDSREAILDHYAAHAAFLELEGIALDALDDAMTREMLEERLSAVTFEAPVPACKLRLSPGTMAASNAGRFGPVPEVAAALLGNRFTTPSVWSCDATGGMRVLTCEGLPDPRQARGLFDMDAPVWLEGGDP